MWIHKLQTANHENRLAIPKSLAPYDGWRPGAFIAITVIDRENLRLTLLGTTPAEAGEALQRLVRPDRRA